jgi:hypothetical protein
MSASCSPNNVSELRQITKDHAIDSQRERYAAMAVQFLYARNVLGGWEMSG